MDGVALHRPSTRYDDDDSHSNASDNDYNDGLDAAREEEQRYKRYLNASQLHSGELQGLYQTEAPSLSTQRHGLNNNGRLVEQSSAASVDEGPSRTEASESDYSGKPPLQHLGSFGIWGQSEGQQGEDARSPNGTPLPPLREEPAGVEEDRPSSRATSHDGAPGGPTTMWSNVTFQPDTSHAHDQALPTPKTTPFQQPAGLPPGIFSSQNGRGGQAHAQLSHAGSQRVSSEQVASGKAQARGSGAGPALGTMSPKPSERLGHSLGAGDRERMTSQASQEPPPRRGSIEAGMKSELLGDLPPEEQMVLSFNRISSWVQTGNLGKPQLPLKERLKPAHLASSCFKPVKSTAQGVAKVGTAAGSGVQRLTSRMLVRRHKPEDARTDIEAGGGDLGKPGAVAHSAAPKEGYRQILHALSGTVKPGHVLALMGPSGSGKTSLLSIIGGRAPGSVKLEGSVTVNGMKLNKAVRRRIGFVLQDDVLYETLTVQETLQYAGLLRLPRTMSRTDKMARVDAVISVLGLTKSKDTIIGGYFRRGVSGGERKRVSVGHELLINPAVLLLDEPTSGLDSTTALHLVKLLRDLAAGGRAILTTIHQPSSRLYRKLDKVMLLAEGHVMYYGDALHAVDWFDHLGFGLPYGTNLADHILDCAMGEVMYNPQAPGANGSVGKQSAGGRERSMHGGNAVRSLYTTFEQWYANHPDGFTVEQSAAAGQLPMGGTHSPRAVSRASSSLLIHSLLEDVSLTHCPRRSLMGTAPTADGTASHAASTAAGTGAAGAKTAAAPAVAPGTVVVRVHGDNRATDGTSPSPGGTAGGTVGTSEQPQSLTLSSSSSTDSSSSAAAVVPAKGKKGNYVEVRGGAGFFQQVSVLWQRALKVRRFESLSGQQLFQLVGVAVITGLLWWQRGSSGDVAGAADVEGLLFFEMLFVAFRSLFSALFTFPNEFRMLSKERPSGMYKLSAYYIARTLADLPIEVMYPSLYVIIIYWFGGLRATAAAFFGNYLSTLVIVLVAQCWGLLLGGLFMDPKMAQTVTTVLMLTFLLVGGFYVRDVPVWIGWLKYLSFVYWGNRLLIKVEFQGRSLTDCAAAQPGQPCPVIPSDQLEEVLRFPCDPNQGVYPEVLVLIGMLVLLRWVTYLVLRWKTSSQQKAL